MLRFTLTASGIVLAAGAGAAALRYFRRSAVWFTGVMLFVFPLLADTSDWNTWFAWVKRYSVVIPAFLWAFLHAYPENSASRWIARRLIPALLILNVVEAGVLELQGASPFNGVLLILVGVCVPWRFTFDPQRRELGFRDAGWQAACLLTLARLYVLNPKFENITFGAVAVLVLASACCAAQRDSQPYVSWRLYTLYVLILQDSLLPDLSDLVYPAWLHNDQRAKWNGTPWAKAWLAVNALLVGALLIQRGRTWLKRRSSGNISVSPAATPSRQTP